MTTKALTFDAAIFDLDGTLADTLADLADAMNRVLAGQGFPAHDRAAYMAMIGSGVRNLVREALPAEARDDQMIDRSLEQMRADYGQHCLVETRLYDGVAELVAALRREGVKLAVLSNKVDELTRRVVEGLFHAGAFDVVAGARPGVPLKPDPTEALRVAGCLGIPPGRIVYVGDSVGDMLTAIGAGMVPVGVSWGFRARDELLASGAHVVLDHPRDLLALRR
jgi:phosphoglycolate phosphatase